MMRYKLLIGTSFITLLAILCTVFIVTKPTDTDYAVWMEETYNVQCLDDNCDTFEVVVSEEGEAKIIRMQLVHGGYSPGIFIMKKDMIYRNPEYPSYYLHLKIKGILGKIKIVEEINKL